jgi:hypothetical protein
LEEVSTFVSNRFCDCQAAFFEVHFVILGWYGCIIPHFRGISQKDAHIVQ